MTAATPTALFRTLLAAGAPFPGGAAGDLCALADVKGELDISGTGSDEYLARVIRAQSQVAADYINRDLAAQTYEEQFWERREYYLRTWQDRGRHAPLQLRAWPIVNAPSTAGIAPPLAPVLGSTPGGSLPARTYFVKASYVTASGETAASIEASIALAAGALLTVAAPGADAQGLATGWKVYVGAQSWAETAQASLAVAAAFVEPASGLVAGAALPNHILVVENWPTPSPGAPFPPTPLAEGVDFIVDAAKAQLSRLYLGGYTRGWPYFPLTVQYAGGFAAIPDNVQDAVIRLVAMRYFGRSRDPNLKSKSVIGVHSASYVAGRDMQDMPADIAAALEPYRVPLVG